MFRRSLLAALVAAVPAVSIAQGTTLPLRCDVTGTVDHSVLGGDWTTAPGTDGAGFLLVPMLAPEACDASGCTTYTSGWVMVVDGPQSSAFSCWEGIAPGIMTCDLMGSGQVLVNRNEGTAVVMRYESFMFGLPESRVSVSLADCRTAKPR